MPFFVCGVRIPILSAPCQKEPWGSLLCIFSNNKLVSEVRDKTVEDAHNMNLLFIRYFFLKESKFSHGFIGVSCISGSFLVEPFSYIPQL